MKPELNSNPIPDASYDVALSFAGEEREFVAQVAAILSQAGVAVFYDEYQVATLWGRDLYQHLSHVYQRASKYTVVFISKAYSEKLWTNHEMRAAQARAFEERREYILPARFDDTEIPGLLPTTHYIDLRTTTAIELGEVILQKIGLSIDLGSKPSADEPVLNLLVEVQTKQVPLSASVAKALALARSIGAEDLATFCNNELVGYGHEASHEELAARRHRHFPVQCTLGELNVRALGYQGVTLSTAVAEHRDHFFAKDLVLSEPLGDIERDAERTPGPGGMWSIRFPVAHFNPTADDPDAVVTCYAEPGAYKRMVESIRTQLTKLLTSLLAS